MASETSPTISEAAAAIPGKASKSAPSPYDAPAGAMGLAREDEIALVVRCRCGEREATERLIRANIRLIYKVARRYRCRSYTLDDLVQEGIVGLMAAIKRFDETRGYRLSTYALHWIRQAIARAVEQNDRLIHVPVQATSEIRRLVRLREDQLRDHGRLASEGDLAVATGLSEHRVAQLLGTAEDAVSLDALVGGDQETSLLEMAEDHDAIDPEYAALAGLHREQLRILLGALRPREQEVVRQRYGFDGLAPCTLDELSQRMQVSRERVRQIEVRAIQKLRYLMRASQWD